MSGSSTFFLSGSTNQSRAKFFGPSTFATKKCFLARSYQRPCIPYNVIEIRFLV